MSDNLIPSRVNYENSADFHRKMNKTNHGYRKEDLQRKRETTGARSVST